MPRSMSSRNVSAAAADRLRRVLDVQIEDDARIAIARPRQKRLVVFLDQADGAVDDVGAWRRRSSPRASSMNAASRGRST